MARLIAVAANAPDRLLARIDEVWAAGDAALPVPDDTPPAVLDALLARVRPAELRTDDGVTTATDAPPVPDGTALLIATSGSTGTPKAVLLSHASLDALVRTSRTRLGADDGQPWLGLLPLTHVAGLSVVLRSRAAGVEPAVHERDTPAILAEAPPSWMSLVPAQLRRLLDAEVDLARHHGVLVGGAATAPALLERARATGARLVTTYGMTETCGGVVYDGVPLDGVEVRVGDGGRISLRTPTVATGLRTPSGAVTPVTDADGWLETADHGAWVDGELVVHGRVDDVAISGGVNVPLPVVRDAVQAVLGRDAATVVALPDERWGQAVVAVVTQEHAIDLVTLREEVASSLPATHRPTRLLVAPTLPVDSMGKVTPAAVLDALRTGTARETT